MVSINQFILERRDPRFTAFSTGGGQKQDQPPTREARAVDPQHEFVHVSKNRSHAENNWRFFGRHGLSLLLFFTDEIDLGDQFMPGFE